MAVTCPQCCSERVAIYDKCRHALALGTFTFLVTEHRVSWLLVCSSCSLTPLARSRRHNWTLGIAGCCWDVASLGTEHCFSSERSPGSKDWPGSPFMSTDATVHNCSTRAEYRACTKLCPLLTLWLTGLVSSCFPGLAEANQMHAMKRPSTSARLEAKLPTTLGIVQYGTLSSSSVRETLL